MILFNGINSLLVGVIDIAKNSIETFDGILRLHKEVAAKIQGHGSRSNNGELLATASEKIRLWSKSGG